MSTELDACIAKAQTNPDIKSSVVDVLHGVAEKLAARPNDAAYVAKLSSQLRGASVAIGRVSVTVTTPAPTVPVTTMPLLAGPAMPIHPAPLTVQGTQTRAIETSPQSRHSDPVMPPQSHEADAAWRGSHEKKKGT